MFEAEKVTRSGGHWGELFAIGDGNVAGDLKARLFGGEVPFLMGAGDQAQESGRQKAAGKRKTDRSAVSERHCQLVGRSSRALIDLSKNAA